jgi:hypothetical protein
MIVQENILQISCRDWPGLTDMQAGLTFKHFVSLQGVRVM